MVPRVVVWVSRIVYVPLSSGTSGGQEGPSGPFRESLWTEDHVRQSKGVGSILLLSGLGLSPHVLSVPLPYPS